MNPTCIHSSRYFLLPVFLVISFHSLKAQCSSQGALSGSAFSDDNAVGNFSFSNPSNAAASDNSRATAAALITLLSGTTHYLKASDFGFTIPSSATICGIEVQVEKSASNINIILLASVNDNIVKLMKASSVVGSNYAQSTDWSTGDSYFTYGGPTDLWGTSWTPADINATGFGLAFSANINGIVGLLPVARVDHIKITVYYLIPVPIHFINFSVTNQKNNQALIQWTTADNDEKAEFNVQRFKDGYEWETISSQESKIVPGIQSYTYIDDITNSSNKKYYYRVKMTLRSGKTLFTNVASVSISENPNLKPYPNPSVGYLTVNIQEVPVVNVYTMRGLKLSTQWERITAEQIKINLSQLKPGNYILQVNNKSAIFTVQ